jgi:NADPH:quinone reductase-like Zn-dependent oxidoreductase
MKAVQLYGYGDVDQLHYEDVPDPKPGPDEVLVKVAGASINPVDWKLRQGHLKDIMPLHFPVILGRDASGEIVSVGQNVHDLKVGQKVLGLVNGAYAEYVAAKTTAFGRLPQGFDVESAGVLPLVTLTGTQLIERAVKPKAGDTVLVTGALGGVGRSAVHAAKKLGAKVIAGVRANQKKEAESLGVDRIVALDDERELASLKDLDAVADTVGGDVAVKLISKLKKSGVFGSVLGKPKTDRDDVRIEPIYTQPDSARLEQLAKDVQNGEFTIPIARRFKLSEIREAHRVAEKGVSGKVLLVP